MTSSRDKFKNLRQVAEIVAARTGQKRSDVEETLRQGFDVIAQTLAAGDAVSIPNCFTLGVRHHGERLGRNPSTGDVHHIPAKDVPFFRAHDRLKTMVAKKQTTETIRKRPEKKQTG